MHRRHLSLIRKEWIGWGCCTTSVMGLGLAVSAVGMATAAAALPPMYAGFAFEDYVPMLAAGGAIGIIGVLVFYIGLWVHYSVVAACWVIRLLFWSILHIASEINARLLLRLLETGTEYLEYAIAGGACCMAGGLFMIAIAIVPWWTEVALDVTTPVLVAGGMWFAFGGGLVALGYAIRGIFLVLSGIICSAAQWCNKNVFRKRGGGAARQGSANNVLPLAEYRAALSYQDHSPCVVCAW